MLRLRLRCIDNDNNDHEACVRNEKIMSSNLGESLHIPPLDENNSRTRESRSQMHSLGQDIEQYDMENIPRNQLDKNEFKA